MNERQIKIVAIVQTVLGNETTIETTMMSMPSWDSLKTLQIVMALDENGISVPFELIVDIRSVRDIIEAAG